MWTWVTGRTIHNLLRNTHLMIRKYIWELRVYWNFQELFGDFREVISHLQSSYPTCVTKILRGYRRKPTGSNQHIGQRESEFWIPAHSDTVAISVLVATPLPWQWGLAWGEKTTQVLWVALLLSINRHSWLNLICTAAFSIDSITTIYFLKSNRPVGGLIQGQMV